MTYTFDKIQCCLLFLNKKVFFHHGACVPAKELYQQYVDFGESLGLQSSIVQKHQLWSLIRTCVTDDIKSSLDKRISGQLFYLGLDLQEHAISHSTMQNLLDRGIPMEFTKTLLSEDSKVVGLSPFYGEPTNDIPAVISPVEMSKTSLRQKPVEESLARVLNLDETHTESRIQTVSTIVNKEGELTNIPNAQPVETPLVKRGRGRPRKIRD